VQHGSAYTSARSTSQSYGDSKISGRQNLKTLEPIDKNFGVGDYVSMTPRVPKLETTAPLETWQRMREISPSCGF